MYCTKILQQIKISIEELSKKEVEAVTQNHTHIHLTILIIINNSCQQPLYVQDSISLIMGYPSVIFGLISKNIALLM